MTHDNGEPPGATQARPAPPEPGAHGHDNRATSTTPAHDGSGTQTGIVRVVGAAIVRNRRCLAAQRSACMSLPLKWEFPGGKVETGEEPEEALVREIQEELGVDITVGPYLATGTVPHRGQTLILDIYEATLQGEAEPVAHEHATLRWVTAAELTELDWAEADRPPLRAVRAVLEATT